ncbi:unnamed protein product [Paramecium sonneborni]|uniref:Uncharacterized protein n=1 Tax=Paramecium sonneborni TaxID=65129 RepID=A0A8S1P156_9CILI|nr:unnamed protein product [Paramecium sonneborni]
MINDIKDSYQQNNVNYVILILVINGRFNKLKLIQENYITQALSIAAAYKINTIRNIPYYENFNRLLEECYIKSLQPEDNLDFFKPPKDKEKPDPRKNL